MSLFLAQNFLPFSLPPLFNMPLPQCPFAHFKDGCTNLCSLQKFDQQLTQVFQLVSKHLYNFEGYPPFQALKLLHVVERAFLYQLIHCFVLLASH